jgi:hypothetical protein
MPVIAHDELGEFFVGRLKIGSNNDVLIPKTKCLLHFPDGRESGVPNETAIRSSPAIMERACPRAVAGPKDQRGICSSWWAPHQRRVTKDVGSRSAQNQLDAKGSTGETEDSQTEAHDLSGGPQKDRSGPKNAVGEGKERSVTEGIKRMIWAMARHITLPALKHGRGNPNWGKPPQWLPPLPTEFEALVKKAGLTTAQYVASTALRRWCDHNRSRCYVPEWLPEE